MLPTVIGACVVAAVVIWIVAVQIRNRIKGKSSCSCGGNCGACGLDCHGPKSEV
ncbi:MAG: FeoB-associated Cys-rich membrane protein [Clostridia bacterium]|nr:FeoB-associated Cys-rich membrane protein [Clostridia bacterium]